MSRPSDGRAMQLEDFAPMAPPWAAAVQSASFSACGGWLAYLRPRERTDLLDLWVHELATHTDRLLLAGEPAPAQRTLGEQLARERVRQRYEGVTHLAWVGARPQLLSVNGRQLHLIDAASGQHQKYVHPEPIDSAEPSSGGNAIAFASGRRLWHLPLAAGTPAAAATALTPPVAETLSPGVPDNMTAEEIFNGSAFCWSEDAQRLLVATFDTTSVEPIAVAGGLRTTPEIARYARPGCDVAVFSLSCIDVASGAARELLPADPRWPYFLGLYRRNAREELLVRMRRDQCALQWLRIDWTDGVVHTLLEHEGQPWINAPGRPLVRASDDALFIVHENAGRGCIGLYDRDGRWQRDIGSECGHVEALVGLEAEGEAVTFLASGPDPRNRHVYRAEARKDWRAEPLTHGDGVHTLKFARGGSALLHLHDTLTAAPEVKIVPANGTSPHRFAPLPSAPYESGLTVPRLLEVRAADDETVLHAAVYGPAASLAPCPVVLLVYGGPRAQAVRHSRALALDLRAQWLVQRGCVVVKIDNRGTAGRGIEFERAIHRRLGQTEVDDQCAALAQVLRATPQADASRVAVCGWSYGGYMALRCLQRRGDLFCAAIAGAPVVRWEDYDAPYTERYMGTPVPSPHFGDDNAGGYRDGTALPQPDGRARRLLLIHGLNDENVLFRHTAWLIDQLAREQLPYDLLLLPDERHGVRAPHQRMYLEQRITEFLQRAFEPERG